MIASILLTVGSFLLIHSLCAHSKNNSGSIKCSTLYGRFIAHHFAEYLNDRVCRICGLVQKEEPAGLFMSDGDTWYDKGYAEDKDEMVNYITDSKNAYARRWEARKQENLKQIRKTRIKAPKEEN